MVEVAGLEPTMHKGGGFTVHWGYHFPTPPNFYHIETHSAPLTTLFLSIQDAPGMNPADLLGCLYLSIQIENVFLYNTI